MRDINQLRWDCASGLLRGSPNVTSLLLIQCIDGKNAIDLMGKSCTNGQLCPWQTVNKGIHPPRKSSPVRPHRGSQDVKPDNVLFVDAAWLCGVGSWIHWRFKHGSHKSSKSLELLCYRIYFICL